MLKYPDKSTYQIYGHSNTNEYGADEGILRFWNNRLVSVDFLPD
jgi:hypothetical protein